MIRKLGAAAALVLALGGCGASEPFSEGEARDIKGAVDQVFTALEREEYPAAADRWCAAEPITPADLGERFGSYPRPWSVDVTGMSWSPGVSGSVNVTVVDAGEGEHRLVLDVRRTDGWQVCGVQEGSVVIDPFG